MDEPLAVAPILPSELKPNYKWNNNSILKRFPIDFHNSAETNVNVAAHFTGGLVNVIGKSESDTHFNIYAQDHNGNIAHIESKFRNYFTQVELGCVLDLQMITVDHGTYEHGVPYKIDCILAPINISIANNVDSIVLSHKWDTLESLKYRHGHCVLKFEGYENFTPYPKTLTEVYASTEDGYPICICFWEEKQTTFNEQKHILKKDKLYLFSNCHIRSDPFYPHSYAITLNAKVRTTIEPFVPTEETVVVTLQDLKSRPPSPNDVIKLTLMKLIESQRKENMITSMCSDGSIDPKGRFNACILRTSTDTIMNIPIGCYFELKVKVTQENGKLILTGVTDPVEWFTQESSIQERGYNCL